MKRKHRSVDVWSEWLLWIPPPPLTWALWHTLWSQQSQTWVLRCDFKLDWQIGTIVKSSFFHLRQLAKVKPFLAQKHFETVIHAFITSQLDYCNALYFGVSQSSLTRLQLVQNAAARLLTRAHKREHITPILASLHWLPVHFRVHFKILLFVFKYVNGVTSLSCSIPPLLPGASGQLISWSWRYRGLSGRSEGIEVFVLLVPNYGMTSHCTSDKPLTVHF